MYKVFSVESNVAAFDITVIVKKTKNAHCGNTFTGTGFANKSENFTGIKGVAYAVNGFNSTAFGFKECSNIVKFQ